MANLIFPTWFDEKTTIAQDDMILMADSEDNNKIKKAKYSNLKWEKWEKWEQWPQWEQGIQWEQWPAGQDWQDWQDGQDGTDWASVISWEFSGNDLVFTKDDGNTVTIENAAITLQWPQWEEWEEWPQWPAWKDWADWTDWEDWNWIASITATKAGKTTTVTITETSWNETEFEISDWQDGQGSWDVIWPNSSTNEDIALMDGTDGKHIKDWGKKLSDLVQTSGDQTINWTKTFGSEPVLPSKSSDAWNNATKPATEAQVYKKQDTLTLPSSPTSWNAVTFWANNKTLQDAGWAPVLTSWNQTINGTKTFWTSPVVPSKTTDATNTGTAVATEAQVYKKQDKIDATHKLDADLVDDTSSTNKFVTATDKTTWSGKQDALTLPSTPTSWHIVTWWADNKTLADGWAVPTWVPAVWTNWQVLTVVSWAAAWANAPASWIQNDTTWTTTTVTKIRAGSEAEYAALQSHSASVIYHIY